KAASGPVVDWGGPADLKSALKILFTSIKLFMLDFTPAGFAVILVGVSASWHRRRTILAALALIVIGNVALMAHYGNEETLLRLSLYLFPSYIVLSIWAGCGIDTIYSYIRARLKVAIVPSAILIIVPLACLITHYRLNDQSKNFSALDYGRNIFKTVPRGSVLLSDGNTTTGPLQYLQAATESEEGVIVIDRKRIALDSYCRHLIAYYPGAVPQDILSTPPEQRLARVIEANISKTPLYTTFLLSEIYDYIPYGLVYRIAPKGTPTDFAQIKKINNALWNGYTKRGLLAPHDHKGAAEKNIVRKYAESRSGLGLYYSHSGHTDEARAAYEESIKIDPGHFSGLFHLGTLLTELGDKGKGADLLEKAMNADPDFFLRNTPVGGGIISEEMIKAEEHVQSANHYTALNDHK
ncbi:MAG: tetratricopeptide repeat protein, partial [Candidatus Omnitrophica bacterium]|nr:tetratricopeptide repeat protein [Candidatus Omnitrophota bacterium]